MAAAGRDLPPYFFKPLYKHPPLFTFFIAFFLKMFGTSLMVALILPVLFGVLLIPLTYYLASMVYNRTAGILASVIAWLDPVSIMSSQKIWMDTSLAFFTVLSVACFIKAIQDNKDAWFLLSAVAIGLGTNIKYTVILMTFVFFLYALFYQKKLFGKQMFNVSLVLPVIMLVPWIIWNLNVYGFDFFRQEIGLHYHTIQFKSTTIFLIYLFISVLIFCIAGIIIFLNKKYKKELDTDYSPVSNVKSSMSVGQETDFNVLQFISLGIICGFLFVIREALVNSLDPYYVPASSWLTGYFKFASRTFYFTQTVEFCVLYIFAVVTFFYYNPDENQKVTILRMSAIISLIFFIAWGGYQSRYILGVIPLLIVLSAGVIIKIYEVIAKFDNFLPRTLIKCFFTFFVLYALYRTYYINLALSFTNDMCYF